RRHTRSKRDWSSDVCSSDLKAATPAGTARVRRPHNERILRVRRLRPCPRKASACSESHSRQLLMFGFHILLLIYEFDSVDQLNKNSHSSVYKKSILKMEALT